MEFRQIEAFVNAVKYKSFSRAADVTFLSQPTISAHIGNLESEIGAPLLNRVGREVTLTPRGQVFYPYAVSLLNTRQKALSSVKTLEEEMQGVLDIQTSTVPGQYFLPGIMAKFSKGREGIRYYLEQSDSRSVMENIKNQRGEIGFTGSADNSSLHFEPVFTDEFMMLAPDSQRLADYQDGAVLSLEDFRAEAFIFREEGSGTRHEMEKADHNSLLKNMRVAARMNNMESIRRSVAHGLGVSIVSSLAISDSSREEGLRYFRLCEFDEKRTFYMSYNKNICLSPLAEMFCDFVRKQVK